MSCSPRPRSTRSSTCRGTTSPTIEERPIVTAFTQRLPAAGKLYRWYLPLHPWAIESLRLPDCDLVLSSSHCVAKSVKAPEGAVHVCYCHTPMRYVWDRFDDYFGHGLKAKLLYDPVAAALRRWDRKTATRADRFVANSRYVAERIRKYYDRDADAVIPPPVDTDFYVPSDGPADEPYYLIVSALVPYKRIELAIEAFRGRDDALWIVGCRPLGARAARPGARQRSLSRLGRRRAAPRALSGLPRVPATRGRGLRHRSSRSAGLRGPRGRSGRGWSARQRAPRRDRRAVRRVHARGVKCRN